MRLKELHRTRLGRRGLTIPARVPPADIQKENWQVNGYDVYIRRHSTVYFVDVYNKSSIIAKMNMYATTKTLDDFFPVTGIVVMQSVVDTEYQGKGIGIKLYQQLILKNHWNIYSDVSHSIGARKLWVKLNADPNISVFAINQTSHKVAIVTPRAKELSVKDWNIYNDDSIILLAVATNSSSDTILKKLAEKNDEPQLST